MAIWKCIPPALCGSFTARQRPNHAPRYSNTSKTTSAKRCREGTFLMISAWLCVIRLTRLTYHNPKLPSEISSVWEPDIFSYWHRRKLCKIKLALLYQCRALPTRPPVVTDVSHQLCKEAYKFALRMNTFNSVWSSQVVFCVFKVYTLFMLNSQSNLFPPLIITKLKHDQEVSTWHEKLYLCYLIPACKIQSLPYCWHTNILLESPSRSYPFNVVYKP